HLLEPARAPAETALPEQGRRLEAVESLGRGDVAAIQRQEPAAPTGHHGSTSSAPQGCILQARAKSLTLRWLGAESPGGLATLRTRSAPLGQGTDVVPSAGTVGPCGSTSGCRRPIPTPRHPRARSGAPHPPR